MTEDTNSANELMSTPTALLPVAIASTSEVKTNTTAVITTQWPTSRALPPHDTGESTVEEKTLGLLPKPFQKYGIKFAATYIGETLGNVSGGLKQGAIYEGRLNLALDVDFQKLFGLPQLTFHANMFQIHGNGLSRSNLQNFMVVSGIEPICIAVVIVSWRSFQRWVRPPMKLARALRAALEKTASTKS